MHVLLTGMSGTGKSTLVGELVRRGHAAYDADAGFSEPRADGRWGWRRAAVARLLDDHPSELLLFAGCSEEQASLPFDVSVVLTAPTAVLVERLRTRTTNPYGRDAAELANVLRDVEEVQPLLLRSADLVLDATCPPAQLADALLGELARRAG